MKMKDYNFLRNTLEKGSFQKSIYLFVLIFVFGALGSIQAQTVSISASQPNADEDGPVNGQYIVNVTDGAPGTFYSINLVVDVASTAVVVDDYTSLPTSVNVLTNLVGSGSAFINLNVVDDNIVEATETVILNIVGSNPALSIGVGSATVNITDDDVAGVNVSTISGDTGEDGTTATFTVTLDSQPTADVTVALTSNDTSEGTVQSSVVIPVASWNTGTIITVTGVDDFIIDGDINYSIITGNVTSADPNYNTFGGGDVANVAVTNNDNDVAGVNVNTTTGTTNEAGGTATFIYTLTSQPTDNVVLEVDQYDNTETSGPSTITITPSNWNTGVPLTITGLDDDIIDGDIDDDIRVRIDNSDDSDYDSLNNGDVPDIVVTNIDDDVAGVNVSVISGNTTEAGGTATFTVTLESQPTNNVTIALSSSDTSEGTVAASVVKTPANWNLATAVTVTGVDDAEVDGDVAYTIVTGNVTSGDANYNALNGGDVGNVAVINTDNDAIGVNISPISGNTTEGGGTATFTVTLDSQPTNNVTIALSSSDTSEGTVPASVVKTPANWDNNTVVTVTGVDDALVDGDVGYTIVTGNVTSGDANYNALNGGDVADVAVINTDNDTVGVNVSAISGNTTEAGGTATFSVTLDSQPTNNVTIALSSSDTSEGAVAASVVKTPANWDSNTVVTVTGVDDTIVDGDVAYTIVTGNVTSGDANYNTLNGGDVADVAVTNIDDDVASITISDVAVNEDVPSGNLVFNVVLDIAVAGGTTVGYTFSNGTAIGGGTDFTANPGTLTFDGTAGEIETITVAINNDQILEQTETFTVQLGLPSNGVNLSGSGTATGTINDDDNCAAAPILDTSISTVFCDVIDRSLNDYTSTTPPAGTVLTWSTLSDPLNENAYLSAAQVANPPNDGSYFGFFLDNNGTPNNFDDDCASGTIEVELTLNTTPDAPVGTGNERCGPGTVLLTATTSSAGASLNWYNSPDSDTPIGNGNSFTTPSISATTSFYVGAVENGCDTERVEVVATVGFQASAGTPSNASICSIADNGPTILDLDDRLAGEGVGTWAITTDPSGSLTIGPSNIIDFRNLPLGNYVFTFTTTGSTAPCENVSSEVTIAVSDCDTDEDGDGLFGGDEATLGTDPNNADTDGDGIEDGDEVGPDVDNPLDEDNDGIIDALDSNVLDSDNDGVNDQQDPANGNPCIPSRANGVCDFDGDQITDADEIANGSDPDNPCDPNADSPTCIPIDLAITKEVDNENAAIGDTVVFTITISNPEDRTASNIIVGDLLETGFEFVSSNPSVGSYSEITGEWNNFEVASLSSETLEITALVIEGSSYSNTAELLSSLPLDDNETNNIATVQVVPDLPEGIDLVIRKTVDNRAPLVGEQITFTISVENQSEDGAVISNIEVEDLIPTGPEARFVYVSDLASVGLYNPMTGIWAIESLAVGEQNIATLQLTVSVPREGIFVNTATLIRSSPIDGNPGNNESFVDVTVSVPTAANPGFLFNQFSPNGDNSNDVLRINLRDADTGLDAGINYKIVVYDRYGNLVFEGEGSVPGNSQRVTDVWDGTYNGKDVPKGTYFYILNYDIGAGPTIDKGWIQLIR
jgi:gliding motility-associated-like protein